MKRQLCGEQVRLAVGVQGETRFSRRRKQRADAYNGLSQHSRTALITGASSGIGEAYARKVAAAGYDVVLVARRKERLDALAVELGEHHGVRAEVLQADLSTEAGIDVVERRIVKESDIDVLVNCAGYDVFGGFAGIPVEQTLGLIHCHVLSSVRFCRAALEGMIARGYGVIVNVSSVSAFVVNPKDVTYSSVKAYLAMFSRCLAADLAGTGVRVQALCPGLTTTEFHDSPTFAAIRFKERVPRTLWMTPKEVVDFSWRAVATGRVIQIPGLSNRLLVGFARLGLSSLAMRRMASFFPKKVLFGSGSTEPSEEGDNARPI